MDSFPSTLSNISGNLSPYSISSGTTTKCFTSLASATNLTASKKKADPEFATKILAIGRGGKKPRKDLAVWKDAKPYMGFFYDEYLEKPAFDEKFAPETVKTALSKFLEKFDIADDANTWFNKVKDLTEAMGYAVDMKAYKNDPTAYPGSVADISMFIRVAVTGKMNAPDLYTVMQILGKDETVRRIENMIATL